MQHSEAPFVELERARKAVEGMRQAGSLDDFEECWKEYLRRLERVWNKSENHFRKSPKWDSWHGPYKNLRRKDSMLAYLINARGADEHTISEITEREAESVYFRPGPSGQLQLRNLRTGSRGELVNVEVYGDTIVEFQPAKVRLVPVVNRGVLYPVPSQHLSQQVDAGNLLDIAERGIDFYADFLKAAETYFIR